jgi:Tripartite tricarboxylate transporter TctB family
MSDPESSGLAKNHTVDAVVALILFAFGAVVAVQAWLLGARWTSDGPGAGYFPFYVGVILCVSALGIFVQARFGKARDPSVFVDREQLVRVLYVFLPAVLYVLAIHFVGLYVASAIYVALFMITLGRYALGKSVLVGVAINAALFIMFEVWFKVPLYKGTLDPLRLLGY